MVGKVVEHHRLPSSYLDAWADFGGGQFNEHAWLLASDQMQTYGSLFDAGVVDDAELADLLHQSALVEEMVDQGAVVLDQALADNSMASKVYLADDHLLVGLQTVAAEITRAPTDSTLRLRWLAEARPSVMNQLEALLQSMGWDLERSLSVP